MADDYSREDRLRQFTTLDPAWKARGDAYDKTAVNLAELQSEIDKQADPTARAVLVNEYKRLTGQDYAPDPAPAAPGRRMSLADMPVRYTPADDTEAPPAPAGERTIKRSKEYLAIVEGNKPAPPPPPPPSTLDAVTDFAKRVGGQAVDAATSWATKDRPAPAPGQVGAVGALGAQPAQPAQPPAPIPENTYQSSGPSGVLRDIRENVDARNARLAPPPASVLQNRDGSGVQVPDQPGGFTPQEMAEGSVAPWKLDEQRRMGEYVAPTRPASATAAPPASWAETAGQRVMQATANPRLAGAARAAGDLYLLGTEAGFTGAKLASDIANLGTLGLAQPVSDWLGQTIQAVQDSKSVRYQEQKAELGRLLKDPNAGVMDVAAFMAANPAFTVEIGAPSVPSMLLGVGGARLAVALAGRGAARESAELAGATAANVAMNAGDTFTQTQGPLPERLAAAGAAGAGTALLGRLGGAEAAAASGRPASILGTAAREGAQEFGESMSQSLGQGTAEGNFDLGQSLKQATLEGTIGAGIGGGVGALSKAGEALRPTERRKAANDRLDDFAAEHGIKPAFADAAKKEAEGMPLAEVPGFYKRFMAALTRRLGRQADDAMLGALDEPKAPAADEAHAPTPAAPNAPATLADRLGDRFGLNDTSTGADVPHGTTAAQQDTGPVPARELLGTPLDEAAHQAATSPTNDRTEPTDAQKQAGNYKMGHVRISGMDVSIENPAGSIRRSTADAEQPWEVTMPAHYGYIKGTEGSDGDHVDLFIGPKQDNGRFWVINQTMPDAGTHDEHKVVTGVDSAGEAVDLYKRSFADGFGDKVFGSVSAEFNADQLKERLPSLKKARPVIRPKGQQAAGAPEASPVANGVPSAGNGAATVAPAPNQGAQDAIRQAAGMAARPARSTGDQRSRGVPAVEARQYADRAGQWQHSGEPGGQSTVQPSGEGGGGQVASVRAATGRVIARAGRTPAAAQPIELRPNADGTLTPFMEGKAMLDFDSAQPIILPAGVSDLDAKKAIRAAGAVSNKVNFFAPAGAEKTTAQPEQVAAPPAAEAPAQSPAPEVKKPDRAARAKARMALDPTKDSMLEALAKLGGIRRDVVAREFGLKPEELKHTVNMGGLKGFPFRKSGGMALDRALTALREAGYFTGVSDEDARAAFEQAIYNELGGGRELTAAGQMADAQRQTEERALEEEAAARAEYDAESKAEREAIMAEAGVSDDGMATIADDDIDIDAKENTSTEDFMRAMGASEQEIADAIAQEQANRRAAQGNRQEAGHAAGEEARAPAGTRSDETRPGAAEDQGLNLTAPTKAQVLAQQAAIEKEQADREAPADQPRDQRTADQVDLFNTQGSVFDQQAEAPATETPAAAEPKPAARPEDLIALRKRASVLKSLMECLSA